MTDCCCDPPDVGLTKRRIGAMCPNCMYFTWPAGITSSGGCAPPAGLTVLHRGGGGVERWRLSMSALPGCGGNGIWEMVLGGGGAEGSTSITTWTLTWYAATGGAACANVQYTGQAERCNPSSFTLRRTSSGAGCIGTLPDTLELFRQETCQACDDCIAETCLDASIPALIGNAFAGQSGCSASSPVLAHNVKLAPNSQVEVTHEGVVYRLKQECVSTYTAGSNLNSRLYRLTLTLIAGSCVSTSVDYVRSVGGSGECVGSYTRSGSSTWAPATITTTSSSGC